MLIVFYWYVLYDKVMKNKHKLNEQDEYLTLAEVSELLRVHPNTLRNWDINGVLIATRIGVKKIRRYKKTDIENFIKKTNEEDED